MARKKTAQTAEEVKPAQTVNEVRTDEPAFPKKSFLRFERYSRQRDLLAAVLEDGRMYTVTEVDGIVKGDNT